jgi:hypothetical protein
LHVLDLRKEQFFKSVTVDDFAETPDLVDEVVEVRGQVANLEDVGSPEEVEDREE